MYSKYHPLNISNSTDEENLLKQLQRVSDQHLFSLNNVNTYSRAKVIRINKMILKGKCFDLSKQFSSPRDLSGEFIFIQ